MNNTNLSHTTQLQQTASNPKNSAWVFASAGSGKTKILTDRVLRLLLDDTKPNKILCLTFTKVAAAEMQQRINVELAKWILCSDEELIKKLHDLSGEIATQAELKKARTLFVKIIDEEAKIKVQTIHSFCQTLIKIFPFEAKVSPTFEVLEENQEKLLLKQAQKEVLKRAAENAELKNLIQKTNAKLHEESFSQLVSQLLNKKEQLNSLKENFFGIENVIDEIFKNFSVPKSQTEAEIFTDFLSQINREKNINLASNLEIGNSSKNSETATKIRIFIEDSTPENFKTYKLGFFTKENEPRKIYGEAAKDISNLNFMTECQKIILDFLDKANSLKIANDTALLLRLIDHILENYSRLKKQNSVLDYNDLIVETNRLLANPDFSNWIKLKMDGSFDHILIDESQDTNHQQWNIIKALSEDFFVGESLATKKRSIFIVGDEKQSIYSFQGAEPNISAEIFDFFAARLGDNLKKIELNNSFRSGEKVLQAVDQVFANEQRKKSISKVSKFSQHKPIRDSVGKVEIWPQVQKEKELKKEKNFDWQIDFSATKAPQEEEILAEIIAQKIKSRVLDCTNSINYDDFMILLRNRTNGFDRALVKFFHQYQIPFTSVSRIKFSESLLIQDLLSAAKFVLLPQDDLNLACLLKSPIFEMSEEDLLQICLKKNSNQTSIYKALHEFTSFSKTLKNLEELIEKSQSLNSFEFFYFLLHKQNHQQNFIAHFGLESLEIMDKFILNAFDFAQNFSPNLQKFLEFIERLDPKISLSSNENNCVRISTIHSAKGLQAPVVILADCAYNFNQLLGAKEEISWLEFGKNKFPLWCRKKDDENRILKTHRAQKLCDTKDEYLRLLYVAMTRAEDELYIGGFGGSADPESWYEVVKNSVSCAEVVTKEEFLKPIEISNDLHGEIANQVQHDERESSCHKLRHLKLTSESLPKTAHNQIEKSQIKGRLIHKIFEIIGKNFSEEKNWLSQLAKKIIEKEDFLNIEEKNKICDEILSFLNSDQFEKLFCGQVKCEVEVAGKIQNNKIIGRIDLLIEKENEVLIVDYKSDEALPNETPQQYLLQLKNYQQLIKNLYPQKQIKIAIFWTAFLKLEIF
jgi:ATP-dependent helicase/nuclease subunit A